MIFCIFSEAVVPLKQNLTHTPPALWLIPRRWGYNLGGKKRAGSDKQEQNVITADKMFVMLRRQDPSSVNTGAYESCRCRSLGL